MNAPRFISGIPGWSGFSMNTSSPLMVARIFAERAIIGIAASDIRKDPAIMSFLVGSRDACSIPNKSAAMVPSV
jgi:hypothetical protein